MKLDLHVHSCYSDGKYTPEELVKMAVDSGIAVLGLTDHDTVEGLDVIMAAAAPYAGQVQIVPGVEISTKISNQYVEKASVHILGYFVDWHQPVFLAKLREIREVRLQRFAKMKAKLEALGYKVNLTIEDQRKQSLGRPHLANALVNSGYFKTVQEVFDHLLAKNKPAFVSLETLSQAEAVDLIHKAGGLAFLAHPEQVHSYESVVELLNCYPFDGLELYHPSVRRDDARKKWLQLAEKYHLRLSGGSDYHGNRGRYPEELGVFTVDAGMVDPIFRREQCRK